MTESEFLAVAEAVLDDIEARLERAADSTGVDVPAILQGKHVERSQGGS